MGRGAVRRVEREVRVEEKVLRRRVGRVGCGGVWLIICFLGGSMGEGGGGKGGGYLGIEESGPWVVEIRG